MTNNWNSRDRMVSKQQQQRNNSAQGWPEAAIWLENTNEQRQRKQTFSIWCLKNYTFVHSFSTLNLFWWIHNMFVYLTGAQFRSKLVRDLMLPYKRITREFSIWMGKYQLNTNLWISRKWIRQWQHFFEFYQISKHLISFGWDGFDVCRVTNFRMVS